MHTASRVVASIAAGLVLVVGFAAPGSAQDDLVGDRQITVTPSSGLTDGETVTVAWTGYTPDSKVTVIQCADTAGLKSETCNTTAAQFDQPAGPEGSGSVELVVHTGETGPDGLCDTGANNSCVIAANEDLKDGVTATAPITFVEAAGELAQTGSSTMPLALAGIGSVGIGALALRLRSRHGAKHLAT